ncbi:homocysteine methyltransferase [Schizosaccharomyces japonicus yFS275]|uniref:Homocysteine methyltransferase n=1 Tax=Schizosaccharomyces japonicus (strain yFS275 / FY16936) TaxID=402676 RepID=B6K6T6_SCHJY|nr:homocysteine methyltransferase [Schizosaccharomyces japonicus yFS275]EEB09240.1 homocysteine methyltransferase [Schizosaccharomyces japonicus yFS275]
MLVLDGGSTSILPKLPNDILKSKLWTSEALVRFPDQVREQHTEFLGPCNVISTYTYQLDESIYDEAEENAPLDVVYSRGMELPLQAKQQSAQANRFVAISLGSYAATVPGAMEYNMVYDEEDFDKLYNFHKRRLERMQRSNPKAFASIDFLAFESLPHVVEASAVLKLIDDMKGYGKRCWITFTCPSVEAIDRVDGILESVMKGPLTYLWGTGVNCCHISLLPQIANVLEKHISPHPTLHAVLYPDGRGLWNAHPYSPNGIAPTPREWAQAVAPYVRLNDGKLLLGGCCETTVEHLQILRDLITSETAKSSQKL